jgi:tRNA threonylcarbamoyladenosine biosynthesis protein TsaB
MTTILAFDTATNACTVALKYSGKTYSRHQEKANVHSTVLLKMVDELMNEAKISLSEVDVLGVGTGPGSFTGLRIGIGVAQGLAYTHDLNIVGMSTLSIIAMNQVARSQDKDFLTVAHDARMSEIYVGRYQVNKNTETTSLIQCEEDQVMSPEEFYRQYFSKSSDTFLGNAFIEYADNFNNLALQENMEITNSDLLKTDLIKMDDLLPQANIFAEYIYDNIDSLENISWENLAAQYVRNNVAKKSTKKV